ncbi:MAG: hypothetical protein Q4D53_05720 [Leptotrichiaceae bacterium]|nr:hypothetical protein [Leptotrichiaceae bacterium]
MFYKRFGKSENKRFLGLISGAEQLKEGFILTDIDEDRNITGKPDELNIPLFIIIKAVKSKKINKNLI